MLCVFSFPLFSFSLHYLQFNIVVVLMLCNVVRLVCVQCCSACVCAMLFGPCVKVGVCVCVILFGWVKIQVACSE